MQKKKPLQGPWEINFALAFNIFRAYLGEQNAKYKNT